MTPVTATKLPDEPERYNQMGSAMCSCYDTFTGNPAGSWIKSADYDALRQVASTAIEEVKGLEHEMAINSEGARLAQEQCRRLVELRDADIALREQAESRVEELRKELDKARRVVGAFAIACHRLGADFPALQTEMHNVMREAETSTDSASQPT